MSKDTATVNIAQLTPAQLLELRAQFKALTKANAGQAEQCHTILDTMLQERDGEGFKHTTMDMLTALNKANLVPDTEMTGKPRAEWLKKIQTRKQFLAKKPEFKDKVGYKQSPTGLATITSDKIIDWLMDDDHCQQLTVADRKAIIKQMNANL